MTGSARLAFDRLAPLYDTLAAGDAFDRQRQQTHDVFSRWIRKGFRVLEIGCGTGWDTRFLAGLGAQVVACDPSEEMLAHARRKLFRAELASRVSLWSCGLEELPQFLDTLDGSRGFDAVISNFGALNCASTLEPLGDIGRRHLRPGGAMSIGLLGRTCLWEAAYFLLRGDRARAARRRVDHVPVPVAGVDVETYYYRTTDIRAALGSDFALDQSVGVGVFVPPPYLEPRWRQLPEVARQFASGVDRLAGSWPPMNRLGDHTLTRWVKRRVPRA